MLFTAYKFKQNKIVKTMHFEAKTIYNIVKKKYTMKNNKFNILRAIT